MYHYLEQIYVNFTFWNENMKKNNRTFFFLHFHLLNYTRISLLGNYWQNEALTIFFVSVGSGNTAVDQYL